MLMTIQGAATSRNLNGLGVIEGAGGVNSGDNGADTSSISVGLLPNVWGFTVKAPTSNGLDVSGRLGLYTHMNATGAAGSNNDMNIRETFTNCCWIFWFSFNG